MRARRKGREKRMCGLAVVLTACIVMGVCGSAQAFPHGVVARGYRTVGLRSDGTVVAVGKNDYGQLNVGSWNVQAMGNGTSTVDSAWANSGTDWNFTTAEVACTENTQCSTDRYCKKVPGNCTGTGTCGQIPGVCTTLYDPVCGCDGKTYSNECFAAQAKVSMLNKGVCSEQFPFSDDFSTDKGWTGYEAGGWERKRAAAGSAENGNPDPATDHSGSGDNYILGFAIGGTIQTTLLKRRLSRLP